MSSYKVFFGYMPQLIIHDNISYLKLFYGIIYEHDFESLMTDQVA